MFSISDINKNRIKKFLSYYKPFKKIFVIDMSFAAVSAVAVLIFPLLSGYITSEVLKEWNDQTFRQLLLAGGAMAVLIIIKTISNITYAHQGHAMGAKMEGRMREDLFHHYESLSFDFYSHNSVGRLMTLVTNDLTNMTELFHHGPEDLLMTAIKFIGAFVILIHIDVPLTLIVFSVFPILCLIALRTHKRMQKVLLRSKSLLADMNEYLEDTLAGIRTVKAFGMESSEGLRFQKKNRGYVDCKCLFYKVEAQFYETMSSFPQLLTMLVVFFGALLMKRSLNLPVLVMFLLYIDCLYEPIQIMINFMGLYENGVASFKRFMDVMELEPAITEPAPPAIPTVCDGRIEFDRVSFHYPDQGDNVLEDLSFTIVPGEKAAVVGSSGIGKSTLTYLIARFYDVTSGSLKIDGVDIRQLPLSYLRDSIGIVQQEVYLFSGTIRDNICYGCGAVSEEDMIHAAVMAGAHDFITGLASGYDTIVGPKGITLSGGQRQRISIARVFLKNPSILILDEATSALDSENELVIQKALDQLMIGRTSIIIAHRLTTISGADRILVLKDRRIVEQGTHGQLIAGRGEYARLYHIGPKD